MGRTKHRHQGSAKPAPAPPAPAVPALDLYKVLGLEKECSAEDIKRAYRTRALRCHPDKNPSPEAHDEFKQLGCAYSVLSDPSKRAHYDKHGAESLDMMDIPPEEFARMFQDMFLEMMGGTAGIKAMLAGMSKKELSKLPPFPFPKELFPAGTFPEGLRFSADGLDGMMPPGVEELLAGGGGPGFSWDSLMDTQGQQGGRRRGRPGPGPRRGAGRGRGRGRGRAGGSRGGPSMMDPSFMFFQDNWDEYAPFGGDDGLARFQEAFLMGAFDGIDLDEQTVGAMLGMYMPQAMAEGFASTDDDAAGSDSGWSTASEEELVQGDAAVAAATTTAASAGAATAAAERGTAGSEAGDQAPAAAGVRISSTASTSVQCSQASPSSAADECKGGREDSSGVAPGLIRDWMSAAKIGDELLLQRLLDIEPRLLAVRGPGLGHSALHWCAARGSTAAVRWLLDTGAPAGLCNHEGATPLHAAARNGQVEVVQLLLARPDCHVTARDGDGQTAGQLAAQFKHDQVVQVLSQHESASGCLNSNAAASSEAQQVVATEQGVSAAPSREDVDADAITLPPPPAPLAPPPPALLDAELDQHPTQQQANTCTDTVAEAATGHYPKAVDNSSLAASLLAVDAGSCQCDAHTVARDSSAEGSDAATRQAAQHGHVSTQPQAATATTPVETCSKQSIQASSVEQPSSTNTMAAAPGHPSSNEPQVGGVAGQAAAARPGDAKAASGAAGADARAARRAALLAASEAADAREEQLEEQRRQAGEAAAAAVGVEPVQGRQWLAAAQAGDTTQLAVMLARNPALLHYQGQGTSLSFTGHTALHWAAAKGHAPAVRWLLAQGGQVGKGNNAGATPLHAAVSHAQSECVWVLVLLGGADAQALDALGDSPRDTAVRQGEPAAALVKCLDLLTRAHVLHTCQQHTWPVKTMRQVLYLAGVDISGLIERQELVNAVSLLLTSLMAECEGMAPLPAHLSSPKSHAAAAASASISTSTPAGNTATPGGTQHVEHVQAKQTGQVHSECCQPAPPGTAAACSANATTSLDDSTSAQGSSRKSETGTGCDQGDVQAADSSDDDADEDDDDEAGADTSAGLEAQIEAARLKGNAAFREGDYNKAISHYTMALRLAQPSSPGCTVLLSNRSAAYAAIHHFVKSLEDADAAVKLQPHVAKSHSRRGAALMGMRRYSQAAAAYQTALSLEPGYEAARVAFEKAVDMAGKHPE